MPDSGYALLGQIHRPADLRALPEDELQPLAVELRRFIVETLARVGGHFAANLGTVELTLALHYVYDTPDDRIVWDVGHQAYAHKILTERRSQLETIRRLGGLHPFPSRGESEYDTFGTGHSSTSLSAALGMAMANRQLGNERRVVAVIGDGGMTAGLAFEALNHMGTSDADVLVIYNDNDMSISENVGALRDRSAATLRDKPESLRSTLESQFQRPLDSDDGRSDSQSEEFFRSLNINYTGPVDGHDLPALISRIRELRSKRGPQLLHVTTVKGKGFEPAEADPIGYHGVTSFDPVTGDMPSGKSGSPTFTQVFSNWICDEAEADERVVAITPAMREGSGLVEFQQRFPDRYHDVAIAEQHAVTLAAGMATEGLHPVVAIYSTFLQRAYDQLIHDVAIQNLPVLFALDRGGLVGADGATHHGAFDLTYLRCIPNLVLMAPSDENECRRMLHTGIGLEGPAAVRYPRGRGPGAEVEEELTSIPIGEARVCRQARGRRSPRVAMLVFGTLLEAALEAADILDADVVDMRFIRPLDTNMVLDMANQNDLIVTIEDNVVRGGAGSAVNEVLLSQQDAVRVLNLGLPDRFVLHGSREELLEECGLDSAGILRSVQKRLRAKDLDAVRDNAQSA